MNSCTRNVVGVKITVKLLDMHATPKLHIIFILDGLKPEGEDGEVLYKKKGMNAKTTTHP